MAIDNLFLEPEIAAYFDAIQETSQTVNTVLKKERVRENLELYTNSLNTFLVYPDILTDILTPHSSHFSLFFAQRIILRCMARFRQTYATFCRATSKSFLAFLSSYYKCMLVPRLKGFVAAGTKSQAAQIANEKITKDLWHKFPLLKNEMLKQGSRSAFVVGSDYVDCRFTSGSNFDVVGGHPRGLRRHFGVFEEVVEQNPITVNEELIPLMNDPHVGADGLINPKEPQSQKIYITTAGYADTYAYDKNIETLCYAAIDPDNYIVLGGSYIIPLMHGRLEQQTMKEILSSPTFDRSSIDREYISRWSGSKKGSVFNPSAIQALRTIIRSEERGAANSDQSFYVVSADMAKDGSANTAVIVIKVTPKEHMFVYKFVNLFPINSTDYEIVANELKKTIALYDARLFIYDANGIGAALRDWMNKPTKEKNGFLLPGYGIINPPESSKRDVLTYNRDRTICYEIKAGGKTSEQIHKIFFSRISNGSVKFLIKSNEAVNKMNKFQNFRKAPERVKRKLLAPYIVMDQMENELKNLVIVDTSDNISSTMRVDRRDKKIQKDFFSAAEYGIFAVHNYFEQEFYNKKYKAKNPLKKAFIVN